MWPLHGVCGAWGGLACGIFGSTALGGVGGIAFGAQFAGTLLGSGGCVFIDDSEANVVSARKFGMHAVHFTDAKTLRKELIGLGLPLKAK